MNQMIGGVAPRPRRFVPAAPLHSKEALGRHANCGDVGDPGGDAVNLFGVIFSLCRVSQWHPIESCMAHVL